MENKQDLEKILTKAGFEAIIAEGEADVSIGAHALVRFIKINMLLLEFSRWEAGFHCRNSVPHIRLSEAERILTRRDEEVSADYLYRSIGGYGVARRYYQEKSHLRIEWDAKKASKGEWGMVINKMLEMVDCTIGRKVEDGRNVVVAFGTGEIENKNSRHPAFRKCFVNGVSSLGLRIVGVDEYFMLKKCPSCGLFVEMMTLRLKDIKKTQIKRLNQQPELTTCQL
ncbi:hypothetical protein SeLEV6574_g06636 [Synchytrium endobioticum]|uniref:Uncharacterized protein n=1 Tax=Synchytrium endobioticum TaxID=286115 RepID=A0A507CL47_9FUNG|nr:hypothetical protein SeLEV6574_g06636 [Synchytrium endobioticum]